MEQSSKYPRRILIDVKDVCEEAVWNPTFENEWPSTYKWFEPEERGFNTEIVGRMFERDDLDHWQERKWARIQFWIDKEPDYKPLDSASQPICGWVESEHEREIRFCFKVPLAFWRDLMTMLSRSLSFPGASRSFDIILYFDEKYRVNERTGEYITKIAYYHPSCLNDYRLT